MTMRRSECILLLVDAGMPILEAEKVVMTEQQFIEQIKQERGEEEQRKQRVIDRANYQYNRWQSKIHPDDFAWTPANFSYEEAQKYLDNILKENMFI